MTESVIRLRVVHKSSAGESLPTCLPTSALLMSAGAVQPWGSDRRDPPRSRLRGRRRAVAGCPLGYDHQLDAHRQHQLRPPRRTSGPERHRRSDHRTRCVRDRTPGPGQVEVPVSWQSDERIRSCFGRLSTDGISVEFMGPSRSADATGRGLRLQTSTPTVISYRFVVVRFQSPHSNTRHGRTRNSIGRTGLPSSAIISSESVDPPGSGTGLSNIRGQHSNKTTLYRGHPRTLSSRGTCSDR